MIATVIEKIKKKIEGYYFFFFFFFGNIRRIASYAGILHIWIGDTRLNNTIKIRSQLDAPSASFVFLFFYSLKSKSYLKALNARLSRFKIYLSRLSRLSLVRAICSYFAISYSCSLDFLRLFPSLFSYSYEMSKSRLRGFCDGWSNYSHNRFSRRSPSIIVAPLHVSLSFIQLSLYLSASHILWT